MLNQQVLERLLTKRVYAYTLISVEGLLVYPELSRYKCYNVNKIIKSNGIEYIYIIEHKKYYQSIFFDIVDYNPN